MLTEEVVPLFPCTLNKNEIKSIWCDSVMCLHCSKIYTREPKLTCLHFTTVGCLLKLSKSLRNFSCDTTDGKWKKKKKIESRRFCFTAVLKGDNSKGCVIFLCFVCLRSERICWPGDRASVPVCVQTTNSEVTGGEKKETDTYLFIALK